MMPGMALKESLTSAAVPTRICCRCIMDTSDPDITFDDEGLCNHCRRADRILPSVHWSTERSTAALEAEAARIRRAGAGRPYDSIIGLSGGVDSSYTAYLAHRFGLRPLAVHFDNGWNSELAVENIQRIVEACSFDLQTYVIDWREFRDLQRAFLQASVVDIELLTDHAIFAAIAKLAHDNQIRVVLSGTNVATEHGLPLAWVWNKRDWTNIRAIHRAYGTVPIKSFPHSSTTRTRVLQLVGRGVDVVELLNLVSYRRDQAAATLTREFGWRDYGGKHHESLFTKFYQGAILPRKFGIDKRRAHLSDLIRNGEITRADALATVAQPAYEPDEYRSESEYVRKKLGFSEAEWEAIMVAPPRRHDEFATERRLPAVVSRMVMAFRRLRLIATGRTYQRR
jgi:N-acetyl sugar amidotransferase